MKDNTCNYSDEWQPYMGDYDKFEYDIQLFDGRIIENCYPNAGKFNPLMNNDQYLETEVDKIRFSQNPKMGLNSNVSNVEDHFWDKRESSIPIMSDERTEETYMFTSYRNYELWSDYDNVRYAGVPIPKLTGTAHYEDIRRTPKISRNSICSCGSGKKFKKCCINN